MSALPSDLAISGVVTIAQAEPSLTPQQSNSPSGEAMIGAAQICSIETALRKWAFGLRTPLAWLFIETWAIARFMSSSETRYFAAYAVANWAKLPGAVRLGHHCQLREPKPEPGFGRPP